MVTWSKNQADRSERCHRAYPPSSVLDRWGEGRKARTQSLGGIAPQPEAVASFLASVHRLGGESGRTVSRGGWWASMRGARGAMEPSGWAERAGGRIASSRAFSGKPAASGGGPGRCPRSRQWVPKGPGRARRARWRRRSSPPMPGHLKEAPGLGSRLIEPSPSRAHAGPLRNTEGVAPIAGQSHCIDPGVAPIAGAAPGRSLVRAGVADPRPRGRER